MDRLINRSSSLEFVNVFTSDGGKACKNASLLLLFSGPTARPCTLPPYYVITVFLLLILSSPASNILGVAVYSIHIQSSSTDICLSHVVRDLFF